MIICLLECRRILSTACLRLSLHIRVRHAEQPIFELYDEYTHSGLPRPHLFWKRLAQLAGETTAALALLPALQNNYAMAQIVAGQDIRLSTGTIEIPTSNGPIQASVAKPKNGCILEPLLQGPVPT